ncbi:BTAD domain-containing putative transcriptional regulator [Nonomuraea rubra]
MIAALHTEPVEIRVLGPVEVVEAGRPRRLGPLKERTLLCLLVLADRRAVSPHVLVDRLWGDDPPPEPLVSLRAYVSNLRRALEPERRPRTPSLLSHGTAGYRLAIAPDAVDATRFAQLVTRAERALGAGEPGEAERAAAGALSLWRGEPYAELDGREYAMAAQARVVELRDRARELLITAGMEQGRHAEMLGELEALTREHPLRERLWSLRALALYRSGRQGDALDALRTARRVLAEELGIDPGEELRALERDILAQSPTLRPPHPPPIPAPPHPAATPHAVASTTPPPVHPASPHAGSPTAATPPPPAAVTPPRSAAAAPPAPTGSPASTGSPPPAGSPTPASPSTPFTRPALAGRAAELAVVEEALGQAAGGSPAFLLITGEPGIGKTRLAEEAVARAQARGFEVAVGRCAAIEGAPAFWPWTTLLERLTAALPAVPAGVRDDLPGAGMGERADPEGARFRAYRATAEVLSAAAARGPVAIALDDLHWADHSSLRLLGYLAEVLIEGPVLVICTARETASDATLTDTFAALSRRGAVRLALTGLDLGELAGLVPREVASPQVLRVLRDRTGGNPFFVTELVRLMIAGADPREALPLGVKDVVLGRVGRLPTATGELLRVAAVTGREFDAAVTAEAAGLSLDETLDVLEPAVRTSLLVEGRPGRLRFAHALVQEALSDALTPMGRARLHAAVAAAVEARGHVPAADRLATAAHHWLLAVPAGHARRAWQAAAAAARQAVRLRAHDVAAGLLTRAAEVADVDPDVTPTERVDLLLALADALIGLGDLRGQVETLDRARRLAREAGDRRRLVAAATGYGGRIIRPWGPPDAYDPDLTRDLRALAADPGLGDAERARVLGSLAAESYHRPGSELAERERLTRESVACARRAGDPELLAWALNTRYVALYAPDGLGHRLAAAEELVRIGREAGDDEILTVGLTYLGAALLEADPSPKALALVEEAAALAERLRTPFVSVMIGWLRLGLALLTGDRPAAERLFHATAQQHRLTSMWGAEENVLGGLLLLALHDQRHGRLDLDVLTGFTEYGGEAGSGQWAAPFLAAAGRHDEALALIGPWAGRESIARGFLWPHEVALRADVWSRLGDRRACADLYTMILPYAGRLSMAGVGLPLWPLSRSLAQLARALGDLDAAVLHGEQALETATRLGADSLITLIAGELAGACEERGDADRVARLRTLAAQAAARVNARAARSGR